MRPRVHDERWPLGDGRRDDATDEDDVVAAVVLGVHHALDRGGGARRGAGRPTSPRVTSRPSNFSRPLARELPGERLLIVGQQV